jgi:hypothetical protein
MAARASIPIRQGANVWRLLRTDRDGAASHEIPQMAAAVVRWFIRGVGTAGAERGPLHELVSTGPNEWRFGWVRPLRVLSVGRAEPSLPAGNVVADRVKSVPGLIPTVRGQRPWWVLVQFWWRAPDAFIEYPAMREGLFGRSAEFTGADWLLDRAVIPSVDSFASIDPGDATWNQAQGAKASQAIAEAGTGIARVLTGGFGLGVLVALYLLSRRL